MDQNTQQNANGITPTTTTPVTDPNNPVIVGGAFGGTIPSTQEAISDTMPSFSIDPGEFSGPVVPIQFDQVNTTQQELMNEPFAGGFASTHINAEDNTDREEKEVISDIVEAENNNDTLTEVSVLPQNDQKFSMPDFNTLSDLENNNSTDTVEESEDNQESLPTEQSENFSFDLPELTTEDTPPETTENTQPLQGNGEASTESSQEKLVEEEVIDLPPVSDYQNDTNQMTLDNLEQKNTPLQQEENISSGEELIEKETTDDFSLPSLEEENKQESESIAIPETAVQQDENSGDFELPVEANDTQEDQTVLAGIEPVEDSDTPDSLEDISFDLPQEKNEADNINESQPQEVIENIEGDFELPVEQEELSLEDNTSDNSPESDVSQEDNLVTIDELSSKNQESENDLGDNLEVSEEIGEEEMEVDLEQENENSQESENQSDEVSDEASNKQDNLEDETEFNESQGSQETEFDEQTDLTTQSDKLLDEDESENEEISEEDSQKDQSNGGVQEESDDDDDTEIWKDTTHELTESFEEFDTALSNYLSFLGMDTVSIVGLRTDEEEVSYNFSKEYDNSISIEKSNTADLITFSPTESGLEILLNHESIAYYGIDKVSKDTTHYLKEKLGKFTMMISSEHEKLEKAKREENKKIKDTLKNF